MTADQHSGSVPDVHLHICWSEKRIDAGLVHLLGSDLRRLARNKMINVRGKLSGRVASMLPNGGSFGVPARQAVSESSQKAGVPEHSSR